MPRPPNSPSLHTPRTLYNTPVDTLAITDSPSGGRLTPNAFATNPPASIPFGVRKHRSNSLSW